MGGCLRAPIGDDYGDASAGAGSSGELDESTGLGASESPAMDDGGADTSSDPVDECHPSYSPCLPLVDDLNCADVVALGAAPVTVLGPDDYGLDADHDGIGCEQ